MRRPGPWGSGKVATRAGMTRCEPVQRPCRKNPRVILRFLRKARGHAQEAGHLWEGQVAQLVEHMTENHGVGGSIPSLATTISRSSLLLY